MVSYGADAARRDTATWTFTSFWSSSARRSGCSATSNLTRTPSPGPSLFGAIEDLEAQVRSLQAQRR
jgi:hypothetical protein